jgi:hypothetical protein
MRHLLKLDDETLKAISAYLVSVIDEKVLESVYREETPTAATVKSAIADGIARVRREKQKLEKKALKK